ncbi:MAG: hypothetical protein FWD04_04840 [Conexibacteraceae bacterium]|nr:hypothetical protein [Conexibacteraceae bacterium]
MIFRRNANHTLDTSLFDPEHDMDLVTMINQARTEAEVHRVARVSQARMKARRNAIAHSSGTGRRRAIRRPAGA